MTAPFNRGALLRALMLLVGLLTLSGTASAQAPTESAWRNVGTTWVEVCTTPCRAAIASSFPARLAVGVSLPVSDDAAAALLTPQDPVRNFSVPGLKVYGRALTSPTRVVVEPFGGDSQGHSSAASAGIVPLPTAGSSLLAKASGGNLYGYHATFGSTGGFVAILNTATVPAAGAAITPVECTPIAANSSYRTRQDVPDRYTVGVVLVASSSCTTFTAVAPLNMTSIVD